MYFNFWRTAGHWQISWFLTELYQRQSPVPSAQHWWSFPKSGALWQGVNEDSSGSSSSLRTPAGRATCTLAVPWTPSLQSSVWVPPPQSCWDLRKSSLSSPFFSCCACYTQTVSESHQKVETRPLEKQKFPCTPGLAALCGWMSCTWTSLGPWNSAVLI